MNGEKIKIYVGIVKMLNEDWCMSRAQEAAFLASCNKRQLGCIIVTLKDEIISGTNGPPFPLEECNPCPRLNSKSGTDLHLCRAVHAERKALLNAVKIGTSVLGAQLYFYGDVPCKDCLLELIAAGISEIICLEETYYDELSKEILREWINEGGKFRIYKQ